MPRRRYFVTYDISDDRRRSSVFKTLEGYGNWLQYSVFSCDLNEVELSGLRTRLRTSIHHAEDQILIVDLGTSDHATDARIESLGRAYNPPTRVTVV